VSVAVEVRDTDGSRGGVSKERSLRASKTGVCTCNRDETSILWRFMDQHPTSSRRKCNSRTSLHVSIQKCNIYESKNAIINAWECDQV
jgi:hypothetical protein